MARSPVGVLITWYTLPLLDLSNMVTRLMICPLLVRALRHDRMSLAMLSRVCFGSIVRGKSAHPHVKMLHFMAYLQKNEATIPNGFVAPLG